MSKSSARDSARLSDKENRFATPRESHKSTITAPDSLQKSKTQSNRESQRETLREHNSNVKSSSRIPPLDIKPSTALRSSVRSSEGGSYKLEKSDLQTERLQHENKLLQENMKELQRKMEEYESQAKSVEEYKDMEDQVEKLQEELNKNMHRILNFDKLAYDFETLKSEKERLLITHDKEKTVLESRITDLKEQIKLKDERLEQRISVEHNNRHLFNANLNKAFDQNDKWKKLYMMEAKNIISLQHQYKSLIEDNKCHLEYITQLEAKMSQLETKYYELYTDFHQTLTEYRIENLKNTQAELERIKTDMNETSFKKVEEQMMIFALQNELNKEKEISTDLKAQVNKLLDTKQELERNLTMSRHNMLELTGKLEEESAKVAALEDMRINDLQYIANLETDL